MSTVVDADVVDADVRDPQTVMLAGDTHGSLPQWEYLIRKAQKFECDAIFQLGDFGFWVHTSEGTQFLKKLTRMLDRAHLKAYWLDGNHENHTLLRELWGPGSPDHQVDHEGFWHITHNIWYAPRGHRWEWNGLKFLSLGGAYSIDKEWRIAQEARRPHKTMHTYWWPEETITVEEAEKAVEGGKVDVLLSHDGPEGIDYPHHFWQEKEAFIKDDADSTLNRKRLRSVIGAVHPARVFHGHFHIRYTDQLELNDGWTVHVEGLGCDGMGGKSYTIVHLREGS